MTVLLLVVALASEQAAPARPAPKRAGLTWVAADSLARKLEQKALRRRHDQERRKQPAFRGAPAGERGALARQAADVDGELRVQKFTRVLSGHREQAVAV